MSAKIEKTAIVHKSAQLGKDVSVGHYAVIGPNVRIGDGTSIGSHAVVDGWTTIGEKCQIFPHACVGLVPQDLKYRGEETRLEIGNRTMIREFATLNIGTAGGGGLSKLGDDCLMMAYSHLAHDCIVGNRVILANAATLAGHITVEDNAFVGGLSAVHQFVRLGDGCFIGGCSAVAQDVPPYVTASGNRAKLFGLNLVGLKRRGFTDETVKELKKTYRALFQSKETLATVLEKLRNSPEYGIVEVRKLVDFVASSERGVAR